MSAEGHTKRRCIPGAARAGVGRRTPAAQHCAPADLGPQFAAQPVAALLHDEDLFYKADRKTRYMSLPI